MTVLSQLEIQNDYWLLSHKVSFDPDAKLVTVSSSTAELDIKIDLYSSYKEWFKLRNNSGSGEIAMRSIGGDDTILGQTAGDIYFMQNGWRVSYDPTIVTVTGVLFSDDYNTPWVYTVTGTAVYPTQVSSLVTSVIPQLDQFGIPTASENATAIWDSATEVRYAAFEGAVHISSSTGTAGQVYPQGTRSNPVSTLADALAINTVNGFNKFIVSSDFTFINTDVLSAFNVEGIGSNLCTFTFVGGTTTSSTIFSKARLTGQLSGAITATNCDLDGLSGVGCTTGPSNLRECIFHNVLQLRADNNQHLHVSSCESGASGVATPPELDVNGTTGDIVVHKYGGTMAITNVTSAIQISFDTPGGALFLDNTSTAGTIAVGGGTKIVGGLVATTAGLTLVDNTTPTVTTRYLERGIWVDTEAAAGGDGSQRIPFNNLTTAIDFAEEEGIQTLHIYSDVLLDRTLKNFKIVGVGVPTINCNGQNIDKAEFRHCAMEGTYTGQVTVQECNLLAGFALNGFFENCAIVANVVAIGGGGAFIKNCATNTAGGVAAIISMNSGGASSIAIHDYQGNLLVTDSDHVSDFIVVGMSQGSLEFNASNTLGNMRAHGLCNFVDNTAGATVINRTGYPASINTIADDVWEHSKGKLAALNIIK